MNKKILLFCICLSAGVSAAAFADRIVDPLRLPKSIQNYVRQCFPNDAVTLAESDWGVYEVYLESGAKIEFTLSRKWEEITSVSGIPATALPAGVADAVEQVSGSICHPNRATLARIRSEAQQRHGSVFFQRRPLDWTQVRRLKR